MKANRILRYILAFVLSAMAALTVWADNEALRQVKVGFYKNPGFNNQAVNGERSGYGYDFLQLVRRHEPVEFFYCGYDKSWAESLQMLDSGEVDMLCGALKTPDRQEKYGYTFPIGTTNINLYVRNNDVRFRPDDYSSYEGMRIGIVGSEILDARLRRMAARNHFGCTIVDYEDFDSMCKALDDGEVDAVCAIGTHLLLGYRVLDSFDNENIYVIVRKGDTKLLDMLNHAILCLDQSVTMWPLKLYQANYLVSDPGMLEFSESEQAFIRRHNTPETAIRIATDDTWKPYSWYENGQYRGIVVEIVDLLMKRAGLSYTFVEGRISSEEVLKTHAEADLYVDFVSSKQYAEEQGLVVSSAFMEPSVAVVSLKSRSELKSIGLARNTPMLVKSARKRFDNYDFVIYPTTEELLRAVQEGKVDGAMMYDYVAQLYVNTEKDKSVNINFLSDMTLPLFMVSRMGDEHELITIVSKCIDHLDRNECDNIATRYLSAAEKEVSLWDFLKRNPWLPLLILFLFVLLFFYGRYKRMVILAANKAKTRFLHNMSHEIRTPLNAMFGFAQLLGMPDGSCTEEEKAQYNTYIYNSYRMLDMLISDIIDVADSESGNYKIEIRDVPVNEACRSALQFCEFRVPAGVNMYFTTDCPDDMTIQSDGRRIQQVLINYLTNACKNTQKGEIHLHCSISEHPGKVTFSVADTGVGIPKEKADLIFNRFTKLNEFVQGSGLGLNICQTIAHKLHGEVYLDTSYTAGARFVFELDATP